MSPAPEPIEGRVTGNLAELHTTGTLALANAAYGTTARAVDTQVRYDVTLPDLDARRFASMRRRAPRWSKRPGSPCVRSPRTFATPIAPRPSRRRSRPATRGPRSRGNLALPQPAGVDVRLDRLTATAEGARGRSPSRPGSSTPAIASTSIVWPWPAGRRSIEAAGAVAIGDATARAVPADRPLRLTLTDVDLAAVDRLAKTGRDLGGIVNGTATAAGDFLAPEATAHLTVRDGKVGGFTYRSLDATVGHDATRLGSRPGSSAAPSG